MRTIKQAVIKVGFFLFAVLLCNKIQAKEKQIAYYDSLAVMSDSTIWSYANTTIQSFESRAKSVISDLEYYLKTDEEKYASSKGSMSEKKRTEFENKLIEQRQIIEYKKLALAQDLEILQERLYGPIRLSINTGIANLISAHNLSVLVAYERLNETDKLIALNFTQELIAEVLRLEKLRIVVD